MKNLQEITELLMWAAELVEPDTKVTDDFKAMCQFLKYCTKKSEYFLVLTLDHSHSKIKLHEIGKGTINKCIAAPRDIFHLYYRDRAAAIITAHNHPSGTLSPSDEDNNLFRELNKTADYLDIPLLDNLIISYTGYYSSRQSKERRFGDLSPNEYVEKEKSKRGIYL